MNFLNIWTTLYVIGLISELSELAEHSTIFEQVHLSYGEKESQMVVTFSTLHKSCDNSKVTYGEEPAKMTQAANAETSVYHEYIHMYRAILMDLQPGKKYYYQITGTGCEPSRMYEFFATRDDPDWLPTFAIYGDLGFTNDQSLPFLSIEVAMDKIDAVFHIGDFAYNLEERDCQMGNDFMNSIEHVASRVPYSTCPGNHEFPNNFTHYSSRFSMMNLKGSSSEKKKAKRSTSCSLTDKESCSKITDVTRSSKNNPKKSVLISTMKPVLSNKMKQAEFRSVDFSFGDNNFESSNSYNTGDDGYPDNQNSYPYDTGSDGYPQDTSGDNPDDQNNYPYDTGSNDNPDNQNSYPYDTGGYPDTQTDNYQSTFKYQFETEDSNSKIVYSFEQQVVYDKSADLYTSDTYPTLIGDDSNSDNIENRNIPNEYPDNSYSEDDPNGIVNREMNYQDETTQSVDVINRGIDETTTQPQDENSQVDYDNYQPEYENDQFQDENAQQGEETTQQGDETTQQVDETTQQGDETTQQVGETTQQGDETTQQVDETTQQVEETTQQIDETTQQIEETTQSTEIINRSLDDTTQQVDVQYDSVPEEPEYEYDQFQDESSHMEEVTTQRVEETTQRVEETTQRVEETTQKIEIAVHVEKVITQNVEVTAQTEEVTVPPEVLTTQTEEVTVPPEVLTTQTEEVTVPPEVLTTQTEEVTVPPEVLTTQTEEVTVPPEELTTQTEEVTVSPEVLTTQTEEITVPPEELTTQTEEVTVLPEKVNPKIENVTAQPEKLSTQFKLNNRENAEDEDCVVDDNLFQSRLLFNDRCPTTPWSIKVPQQINSREIVTTVNDKINNFFYSLDIGPAHIIMFTTEFYFFTKFGWDQIETQYNFLEENLREANENRERRPWIIVMAHRPLYCLTKGDKHSCDHEKLERPDIRKGIEWKVEKKEKHTENQNRMLLRKKKKRRKKKKTHERMMEGKTKKKMKRKKTHERTLQGKTKKKRKRKKKTHERKTQKKNKKRRKKKKRKKENGSLAKFDDEDDEERRRRIQRLRRKRKRLLREKKLRKREKERHHREKEEEQHEKEEEEKERRRRRLRKKRRRQKEKQKLQRREKEEEKREKEEEEKKRRRRRRRLRERRRRRKEEQKLQRQKEEKEEKREKKEEEEERRRRRRRRRKKHKKNHKKNHKKKHKKKHKKEKNRSHHQRRKKKPKVGNRSSDEGDGGDDKKKLVYGLEELFFKYGVDLQFYGHEHYWVRFKPIYNFKIMGENGSDLYNNPSGPIHFITGSGGCYQKQPEFNQIPDWVAFSAHDYGYTRLKFVDKLHIQVEQTSDVKNGEVIDKVQIVKANPKPHWMKSVPESFSFAGTGGGGGVEGGGGVNAEAEDTPDKFLTKITTLDLDDYPNLDDYSNLDAVDYNS